MFYKCVEFQQTRAFQIYFDAPFLYYFINIIAKL